MKRLAAAAAEAALAGVVLLGVTAAALLAPSTALAQEAVTEHVLVLGETASPPASIEAVAWIAGSWRAEALGGVAEEVWSPPNGDTMVGHFKLVSDGETQFYELETIREEEGSLILRLKHFNADLTGWEERDETVDFPLVKLADGEVYFSGMSFVRIDDNTMRVCVLQGGSGEMSELEFMYRR